MKNQWQRANRRSDASPDPITLRLPKIIAGTLEIMPAGPPWDEGAFTEWLELFEGALRIYYRLPKARAAAQTRQPPHSAPGKPGSSEPLLPDSAP